LGKIRSIIITAIGYISAAAYIVMIYVLLLFLTSFAVGITLWLIKYGFTLGYGLL